jgi:hypothetical protein
MAHSCVHRREPRPSKIVGYRPLTELLLNLPNPSGRTRTWGLLSL